MVAKGDRIRVEKIAPEARNGEMVTFSDVLLRDLNGEVVIGEPMVKGASVHAKVLKDGRADKILVIKFKSKVRTRKKNGHRQPFTEVEITDIA